MQEKIRSIEETQMHCLSSEHRPCSSSGSSNPGPSTSRCTSNPRPRPNKICKHDLTEESSNPTTSKRSNRRKRKLDNADDQQERQARKVAYIHVGEGGERDLEDHLRGSSRVNIQVISSQRLPDIDASDMIHGLDSAGTSRDYIDEEHRCNTSCPVGCQGHLRPNEIIIYESIRYDGKLFGRKRIKGRFVTDGSEVEDVLSLDMTDFRRLGGGGRRPGVTRPRREAVRRQERQRASRASIAERVASASSSRYVPPAPTKLGVDTPLPRKLAILLDSSPVALDLAEENSWNPDDKSFNIVLKDSDRLVMRRHPIAQSTDCIRGKVGYKAGLHLWEVQWPVRQRGTHAVIGVATKDAPLHAVGYQSLVGNSDQSWGWDLGRMKVFHNNIVQNDGGYYPSSVTHTSHWSVPETIKMVLDMDQGKLGFVVSDQWLGWAVTGLRDSAPLYPIASTVWGHCEVKLRYLSGLETNVLTLQDVARCVIRETIGAKTKACIKDKKELDAKIETLPLPGSMKNFVKFC